MIFYFLNRNAVNQLASLEKPVIVGIQGAAVGMGVAILPLCDVVVASDAATFSTPYTRLGQGLEAAASFTFPNIGKALVSRGKIFQLPRYFMGVTLPSLF